MKILKTLCTVMLLISAIVITGCGGTPSSIEVPTQKKMLMSSQNMLEAPPDEYDNLRNKWQIKLTGGATVNTADSDIALSISTQNNNAQINWDSMDKSVGRTSLWSDLSDWTKSATVTTSYTRINSMASAYATSGAALQGNAALAADIVSALDWMHTNRYNQSITYFDNWWDWQIGTPLALGNIMSLMYEQLNATQLANYIAAIDKFVPDPTQRLKANGTAQTAPETGANRLDKALAVGLRGIIGKSSAKIVQARDAVSQVLPYVTTGDGFYQDGSFIQHNYVAYTGGYGTSMLGDMAKLLYLLNGSTWAFTDVNISNVYAWVNTAYRLAIYDGAMMDSLRGRSLSRQYSSDHVTGRGVILSLMLLAQGATTDQAASIKSIVKGWIQRDTYFGSNYFVAIPTAVAGVYSSLPVYELGLLKALVGDSTTNASPEPVQTHVFASMDRVMQRELGFGLGINLFSNRISAFEFGNGENIKGWWTGMGLTTIYNADQTQYDNDYWPTINSYRLPGTTTDRSGSGTPVAWKKYANVNNWVGGAELGTRYAAVGLDLATSGVTGSSLRGKKSWFLFGDKIIAIGAGITSTDGVNIETIAENRKLNANGDNVLTVNTVVKSTALGWSETMSAVQWAHLAGSVTGSDIGYYFPDVPNVDGLRETRNGAWSDINSGGSTPTATNNFLSLAISHGINPTTGTYSYVILPNRSAAQTAAYAASPTVSILERSVAATAVSDSSLGLVGANFWNDISKTININGMPYLTSDKKASVLTQQSGTQLEISVADPTQANTGTINLEIQCNGGQLISADPAVTITQLSPTIKLSVNVNGATGKSFSAKFSLATTTVVLGATADAYVQNGSAANTNFGTASSLVVKNDGVGYFRQSFIKFDLSSIPGTISNAKITITPSSVGNVSNMMNQAQLIASNAWIETLLTWNNQPAVTTMLGSWIVPAVNTPVSLDVTAQANSSMAGDKLISIMISSPTNYGANGWINYASKENGTVANRPKLTVTYY